ncbi:MAG: hypothetical protein R3C00_12435 [Hyphomonas sp.]|nr:hypothetical protein [Hyphomonas sp.]MCB9962066.1 hypothetical protein [Hyphomonas sp.]MCB9971058.1 hypothetical protein [Hyphomonas sp.]
MPVTDWLEPAERWSAAHPQETRSLALLGVIVSCLLMIWLLALVVRAGIRLWRAAQDAGVAAALKRDKSPGYRIVLMKPEGRARGEAQKWLDSALQTHLGTFSFGAPNRIARMNVLKGGLAPDTVAKARRRMAAADADLLVWARRRGRKPDGFELCGLTRGGGLTPAEARPFEIRLPAERSALGGPLPKAAAFLLARELQPALARPQSFRPEKIKVLAEELGSVLDHEGPVPAGVRGEIEAAYCASAVHVAEEAGDLEGLDRVIALSRAHLVEGAVKANPDRALQARMDIGRALLARATKKFDTALVQEAISHLSLVVEALRTDPTIMQAQGASDAMFKAQSMLENRKRFAINFGT